MEQISLIEIVGAVLLANLLTASFIYGLVQLGRDEATGHPRNWRLVFWIIPAPLVMVLAGITLG